jgi:hypothetical protein
MTHRFYSIAHRFFTAHLFTAHLLSVSHRFNPPLIDIPPLFVPPLIHLPKVDRIFNFYNFRFGDRNLKAGSSISPKVKSSSGSFYRPNPIGSQISAQVWLKSVGGVVARGGAGDAWYGAISVRWQPPKFLSKIASILPRPSER